MAPGVGRHGRDQLVASAALSEATASVSCLPASVVRLDAIAPTLVDSSSIDVRADVVSPVWRAVRIDAVNVLRLATSSADRPVAVWLAAMALSTLSRALSAACAP